jgi:hypothetical protein
MDTKIILPYTHENCDLLMYNNIKFEPSYMDINNCKQPVMRINIYGDSRLSILSNSCQLKYLLQRENANCLHDILKFNINESFDIFNLFNYARDLSNENIKTILNVLDNKLSPQDIVDYCLPKIFVFGDCKTKQTRTIINNYPTCDYSQMIYKSIRPENLKITKMLFDQLTSKQKSNLCELLIIFHLQFNYDHDTFEYLINNPYIKFKPYYFTTLFKADKKEDDIDIIINGRIRNNNNKIINCLCEHITNGTIKFEQSVMDKFIVKLCTSKNIIPKLVLSFVSHFNLELDETIQILKHTKYPIIEKYWLSTLQ